MWTGQPLSCRNLPPTACGTGARYNQQKSAGLEADLPSSLRCLAPFRSETALPEANSFRRSRPTVPQHSRGFEEHCSADWWRCDVSERSGPDRHLSRARFDRANAGQYPHTVARKSAIRLRSEHQARRLRRVPSETQSLSRRRVGKRDPPARGTGSNTMPDAARRESWQRASGPSSRITGAVPACTASVCGCGPGPAGPSCRIGVARAVAR